MREEALEDVLGKPYHESMREAQWCGFQLLAWYHMAEVAPDVHWRIGYSLPYVLTEAKLTSEPKPADFGVVRSKQHHVLVHHIEWLTSSPVVHTIAGNTGNPPGVVGEGQYRLADHEISWYSIESYL